MGTPPSVSDEEQPLLKKEEKKEQTSWLRWGVMSTLVIGWFGAGIWVGCKGEGWQFITSCYVMVQIVTTIGYGDILVQNDAMKLWIACYVLLGVLILAGLVSNMAADILAKQEKMLRQQFKRASRSLHITSDADPPSEFAKAVMKVAISAVIFLIFLGAGTIFYATYEACTCSYGLTAVEGCVEHLDTWISHEQCKSTGGQIKTWTDAFYMSVVTLTTVGFGDHSPKSYYGRWFGVFWMLFGVVATGNFIAAASEFLLAREKAHKKLERITDEIFKTIDSDGDGSLNRAEFRSFSYLKFDMVHESDCMRIDAIFEGIDTDDNGYLTFEECEHYFKKIQAQN